MRTLHIGSYALLYSAIYYCQSFSRSVHAFFGFLIKKKSISGEELLFVVYLRRLINLNLLNLFYLFMLCFLLS